MGATAAMMVALTGCATMAAGPSHAQEASSSALKTAIANEQPLVMLPSPVGNYADNLSPFVSNPSYTGQAGLVYQPLVYFDEVNPNPTYLLATGYHIEDGGKTVVVDLRHGVKWTDNTPFTSADVVFTLNYMKKYPDIDSNGVWSSLGSVTAQGPYTVVLHYKKVNIPAINFALSSYMLPEHIWSKVKGDPAKAVITNPVGTGPYIMTHFSPESITYKANMHYYLGVPDVRTVEIPAFSSNTSADLALAKDQVQWSGIFIPSIQQVYTSKNPSNHYWFPAANVITLYPNLKVPGLNNLAVRQAINLVINRAQLGMEGEYGYSKPAAENNVIPSYDAWAAPGLNTVVSPNVAKAQAILEKAGYKKDANGIFAKDGKELTFTVQVPAGWTDWDEDVQLLTQSATQAGIKLVPAVISQAEYFSNLFGAQHAYQLIMSWTNEGPSPFYQFDYELDSKGSFNVEQLSNPQVDQAINTLSTTTNTAVEHKELNFLQKYTATQLPVIPLFYGPFWYEYSTSQYTGWPTQADPYISPSPYQGVAQSIVLMHLKPVVK